MKWQGGREDEGMRSARDNGADEKTQGFAWGQAGEAGGRTESAHSQHTASQQPAHHCGTNDPALFLADQLGERGGDDWQPPWLTAELLAAATASPNYQHVFPWTPLCRPRLLSPHQSKVFLFSFTERDQQTDTLKVFYSFILVSFLFFGLGLLSRGNSERMETERGRGCSLKLAKQCHLSDCKTLWHPFHIQSPIFCYLLKPLCPHNSNYTIMMWPENTLLKVYWCCTSSLGLWKAENTSVAFWWHDSGSVNYSYEWGWEEKKC